jgi:drug/metabolite transporter (DMT)-like permease
MPYLLLVIMVFFWGTAFRATAIGSEHASAVVFSLLRAAPAALVLLGIVLVLRRPLPRGRTLLYAVLSGLLLVTLAFEGMSEGTKFAGAGNAAVLINSTPFFVLLFGRAFLGERISRLGLVGLVGAFAGVVIMVSSQLGGHGNEGDMIFGMAISLVTGAGFAIGLLLVKATTENDPDFDLLGFTAAQFAAGAVALVGLVAIYGHPGDTDTGSLALWESVAWVALGSSVIASLAYYAALRRIPATRASAWQFLAPVIAVVVEVLYGNAPDALVLAGMAIVIAGVAVVSITPGRGETPAPAEAVSEPEPEPAISPP